MRLDNVGKMKLIDLIPDLEIDRQFIDSVFKKITGQNDISIELILQSVGYMDDCVSIKLVYGFMIVGVEPHVTENFIYEDFQTNGILKEAMQAAALKCGKEITLISDSASISALASDIHDIGKTSYRWCKVQDFADCDIRSDGYNSSSLDFLYRVLTVDTTKFFNFRESDMVNYIKFQCLRKQKNVIQLSHGKTGYYDFSIGTLYYKSVECLVSEYAQVGIQSKNSTLIESNSDIPFYQNYPVEDILDLNVFMLDDVVDLSSWNRMLKYVEQENNDIVGYARLYTKNLLGKVWEVYFMYSPDSEYNYCYDYYDFFRMLWLTRRIINYVNIAVKVFALSSYADVTLDMIACVMNMPTEKLISMLDTREVSYLNSFPLINIQRVECQNITDF